MNTFERVSEWNAKAGNIPEAVGSDQYFINLYNQAERVKEELEELYKSISERNIKGIIDGGLDLDVVVAGVNYLSKCDYAGGINAVLSNNDLKITTDSVEANQWGEYYTKKGIETYVKETETGEFLSFTVRRSSDNKILKYENFPEVDLAPYLPQLEVDYYTLAKGSEVELSDYAKSFKVLTLADIIDEEGKGAMQAIMEQAGQDSVRLTIKLPELEITHVESYQ